MVCLLAFLAVFCTSVSVRCRLCLSFQVLAFGLCGCMAFTCSGQRKHWHMPAKTDIFPLWNQVGSVCRYKGHNRVAPTVLAVFFNGGVWHLLPWKYRIYVYILVVSFCCSLTTHAVLPLLHSAADWWPVSYFHNLSVSKQQQLLLLQP